MTGLTSPHSTVKLTAHKNKNPVSFPARFRFNLFFYLLNQDLALGVVSSMLSIKLINIKLILVLIESDIESDDPCLNIENGSTVTNITDKNNKVKLIKKFRPNNFFLAFSFLMRYIRDMKMFIIIGTGREIERKVGGILT